MLNHKDLNRIAEKVGTAMPILRVLEELTGLFAEHVDLKLSEDAEKVHFGKGTQGSE